jgi:hypothetical protein
MSDPDFAREAIQDIAKGRQLASLILSAELGADTAPGQAARRMALGLLGLADDGRADPREVRPCGC